MKFQPFTVWKMSKNYKFSIFCQFFTKTPVSQNHVRFFFRKTARDKRLKLGMDDLWYICSKNCTVYIFDFWSWFWIITVHVPNLAQNSPIWVKLGTLTPLTQNGDQEKVKNLNRTIFRTYIRDHPYTKFQPYISFSFPEKESDMILRYRRFSEKVTKKWKICNFLIFFIQ